MDYREGCVMADITGKVTGVKDGANAVSTAVNMAVQTRGIFHLLIRDKDELKRDSYDNFTKMYEEYKAIIIDSKHSADSSYEPYYLSHKAVDDPTGFYRNTPRLRFAHVFEISNEAILKHQDSSCGNRLIMDTLEQIRHIPTLSGKEKQNLHKVIFGQIVEELCRSEQRYDAAVKQSKYKALIRFVDVLLKRGLYLTGTAADADVGSKLTLVKHSIEQEISNLEIERFKVLISNGAIELKRQANLLIVNTMAVLTVLLEYGNMDTPVVGFTDLSKGIVGTVSRGMVRKQMVQVEFALKNPCQKIMRNIAMLFSLATLDKFDEMVKVEYVPSLEDIKCYIAADPSKTLLAELKAGGILGDRFSMGVNSLASQVSGLLENLYFLAHGLRVFTHLAAVASHQVGDLLKNPAGLVLIETIMNNYVLKLGEISRDAASFLCPLEDKFHSRGQEISSKIATLVNGLSNLRDAPGNAMREQAKLAEAFKFRALIMEELAEDKRCLFHSIDSMNRAFFSVDLAAQEECNRNHVLDEIKTKLMVYARHDDHKYKFALGGLDPDLQLPVRGKQCVAVNLSSRFVDREMHERRAMFIYQLFAIIGDAGTDSGVKLNNIKLAIASEIKRDQQKQLTGKKIVALIAEIKAIIANYEYAAARSEQSSRRNSFVSNMSVGSQAINTQSLNSQSRLSAIDGQDVVDSADVDRMQQAQEAAIAAIMGDGRSSPLTPVYAVRTGNKTVIPVSSILGEALPRVGVSGQATIIVGHSESQDVSVNRARVTVH